MEQGLRAILGVLSVGFLVLAYFEARKSMMAAFRTRLFELRDELFMVFEKAGVSHDSGAHVRLRCMLNGMICQAELLNPLGLFYLSKAMTLPEAAKQPLSRGLHEAVVGLYDDELQNRVLSIYSDARKTVAWFIALGSILGMVYAFCSLGLVLLRGLSGGGRNDGHSGLRNLDPEETIEIRAELRGTCGTAA